MSWLERLREPSTYAGLGLLASALGWQGQYEAIVQAAVAVAGLASVLLREGKSES